MEPEPLPVLPEVNPYTAEGRRADMWAAFPGKWLSGVGVLSPWWWVQVGAASAEVRILTVVPRSAWAVGWVPKT